MRGADTGRGFDPQASKRESLTLVCPFGLDPNPLPALGSRLLVFSGDRGPPAEALRRIMANLSEATLATLHDYFSPVWADVIADRKGEVEAIFLDFLSGIDAPEPLPSLNLPDQEGEVAGISYRSQRLPPARSNGTGKQRGTSRNS